MHSIRAGQIYLAKRAVLGKAEYSRPFLVVYVIGQDVGIVFFSTKHELQSPGDLTLNELDDGFRETGLKETSYLVLRSRVEKPLEFFKDAKRIGHISREVKIRVEEWWGDSIG